MLANRVRIRRYGAAAVATLLVALTCSACTPKPYGIHDLPEINETAMQSGLFYGATIRVGATGFPFEYQYETAVELSAGVDTPQKEEAAVDYLLRLAWAETSHDPVEKQGSRSGIGSIVVFRPDGSTIGAEDVIESLLRDDPCSRCKGAADLMEHLYGRWPGPVPAVPDELTELTQTRCGATNQGPHGTHTCGQIAQIGSEILARYRRPRQASRRKA